MIHKINSPPEIIKTVIIFKNVGLNIAMKIIPNTGEINAPPIDWALFKSLARELIITPIWIFNSAQEGDIKSPINIAVGSPNNSKFPAKWGMNMLFTTIPIAKKIVTL